ncbi:MAG: hypothetical protein NTW16_09825 [Bacteroidetes bacterium]|nr:hypothetical protein [Bacteroidota bacterium]
MKKMMLLCMVFAYSAGHLLIAGGTDKTIENLKAAFKGESTASAKYAAYAIQAAKDGLPQIATMFEATSRAEKIHAANHQAVLTKMGQKTDPGKIDGRKPSGCHHRGDI